METPQDLKTYIDLDAGLGRVRGNKMIYGKMLGMFTGSAEFDALEQALAAEDWAKVSEVAHGIKGMTGNLGFTKLFDTSTELMVKPARASRMTPWWRNTGTRWRRPATM